MMKHIFKTKYFMMLLLFVSLYFGHLFFLNVEAYSNWFLGCALAYEEGVLLSQPLWPLWAIWVTVIIICILAIPLVLFKFLIDWLTYVLAAS